MSDRFYVESSAAADARGRRNARSEEHTSELQSQSNLVCRLLLEKKNVANINQNAKEFLRRNYKSALAQHWLSNDGRNFFRRDHSLECVFTMRRTKYIARWVPQRVRATVAVCIRNAVHIAGERRKPRLVGMSLTSERQRHHGASVKGVFKRNDPGSTRVHSGNLHCVFYCLSTAVHEQSLLAEPPWRNLVHSFGEPHVTLIRRHLHAGVEIPIQLLPNRSNHSLTSMPDVDAANAARAVDIAIAIDVFEPGILRLCYIYRSALREPARHSAIAALGKRLRLGTRYCGLNLNRPHFGAQPSGSAENQFLVLSSQYQPIGASFRLMCTCLVSRYSSTPQGPSSRPKPDCL